MFTHSRDTSGLKYITEPSAEGKNEECPLFTVMNYLVGFLEHIIIILSSLSPPVGDQFHMDIW